MTSAKTFDLILSLGRKKQNTHFDFCKNLMNDHIYSACANFETSKNGKRGRLLIVYATSIQQNVNF